MAKRTSERQRTIARRLAAAKGAATRRANREGKSPARVWAQLKRSAEKQITRAVNKSRPGRQTARAQQRQQRDAATAARSRASRQGWATRRANAAAGGPGGGSGGAGGAGGADVGGTDEPVAGASQPRLFPRDDDYGDPYGDGAYDDYFDGDEEPEY